LELVVAVEMVGVLKYQFKAQYIRGLLKVVSAVTLEVCLEEMGLVEMGDMVVEVV
jgi:hypothetical protein